MKDCKYTSLSSKLDQTWKKEYDEGRFHLLDGILYHRTKHTCVMSLIDRTLINTILHEGRDSVAAGHLSEGRTLERVKTCSWWPNWKKDVAEYCQTCDRWQKANKVTGKQCIAIRKIRFSLFEKFVFEFEFLAHQIKTQKFE
ncbi:hypothetical protein O181_107329 [Austropuccinia psidii MF-1]|uniref:Integrase zinc-binding domain-containing protein n=1 Tax=Austropuccinia psidii MF-1 TaxID=1389203 RepID=A0A9Q3JSX0_9BASI|nr:hypothetical protein [Austropuccinia psidii MF-1]